MKLSNPNRQGEYIETNLTQSEAYGILRKSQDSFIQNLVRAHPRLTAAQQFWFFKKAEEIKNPPNKQIINAGAGFIRLHEMFKKAAETLKRPKIRFEENEGEICLSLASQTSKNPNFIYITLNKEYCGKVSPEGEFSPTYNCSNFVKEYIRQFADDPLQTAIRYGQRTGNCAMCGRTLTNHTSVDLGIGPVCRSRFGL